ncbi:hypothetical protein EHF33_05105 [Deinococcus psychrotolerans]|uniref:Uncharacterized protein n=1 Tax=Deinococcus psychrotolerans TaxID=2489213 RepID=A0A3G8YKV9_9DEIO|nr:hypothetical protein [Deinococcus psychrotolerans]AZI42201.1 hypothetical protein EHF33_05105 [Deinococcus psychrotolerans]
MKQSANNLRFFGVLSLALLGAASAQQAPTYSGPQAVVYIGDNYCSGGYCGYSVWSSFDTAITQALKASGSVRPVRQSAGANLVMKAGINDITGGGGVCLPIVGCLNAKTVKASFEIDDAATGTVIWQDTCEGTSAGYSSWYWWSGVSFDSDESKAAADCAGKLVQKFSGSAAIKPYLTVAAGAPLGTAATVQTPSATVTTVTSSTVTTTPSSPTAAQAASTVQLLGAALSALSLGDVSGLFTSDPLNPVAVKAMLAAATPATLSAAAKLKFSVTPGEDAGAYRLVGLTYTLPDGSERFAQLAVASEGSLNTRSGPRIVYLSAFNPARAATPALDGLSKNVDTMLADIKAALNLP